MVIVPTAFFMPPPGLPCPLRARTIRSASLGSGPLWNFCFALGCAHPTWRSSSVDRGQKWKAILAKVLP